MNFDNVKDFPLLKFEVLATCSSEISLIEVGSIGVFEIARKVRSCIRKLIGFVANQEVISSSKSWSIRFKAANCLVL